MNCEGQLATLSTSCLRAGNLRPDSWFSGKSLYFHGKLLRDEKTTTGQYFVRVFETMQDPDPLMRMYSLLMCVHASCWRASILHLSFVNQEMCQLWSWFDLTTQLGLVSNMFVNLRCFTPNSLLLNLFAWFVWMFLLISFGVSNCTSTCWLKGDPPQTFAALKQHAKKNGPVAVPIAHIFLASVGRL